MADGDNGIIFTQSGVPVQGSADYQHVYDSRWKFLEVAFEGTLDINLPAVDPVAFAGRYFEKTILFKHALNFVPLFESTLVNTNDITLPQIYADKTNVFVRRQISTSGVPATVQTVKCRIYNLAILQDYTAPVGPISGTSSPRSSIGVQFVDKTQKSVQAGQRGGVGFSIDTTQKIISVHKTGRVRINDMGGYQAQVTAIDTTTDLVTFGSNPSFPTDVTWLTGMGVPVNYFPRDAVTFPAPLNGTTTYYSIPVDATHIRLATSYANAVSGVYIDLTTAGSLAGTLSAQGPAGGVPNNASIEHDVGYPPSFLLAQVNRDENPPYYSNPNDLYIGPMLWTTLIQFKVDAKFLTFRGIQAQPQGWFGYVILKDPAEIAR